MSLDKISSPKSIDKAAGADVKKTMAENGFHLVVPNRHEDVSGTTVYDGFETLPNYRKQIDKAVLACEYFLKNGVFIFDSFGNEHFARRAAQESLREDIRKEFGDDSAEEYWNFRNNNLLRAGGLQQLMMGSVLDPLGNKLADIDTPQAHRVCELVARFPKIRKHADSEEYEVSNQKFQWMVDLIAGMELKPGEQVTESTPYRVMSDEQKMAIVLLLEDIARDFLHLVKRKEEKDSVSGVGLEPTT